MSGVYLKVSKMAASVCDIHEASVDFWCWWQNANIESDLGCGCLLSNLERFYDKILKMKLPFSHTTKERTSSSFYNCDNRFTSALQKKNFLFNFRFVCQVSLERKNTARATVYYLITVRVFCLFFRKAICRISYQNQQRGDL